MPEFFTAQVNNDHTRKAYVSAARRFAEWCDRRGIVEKPAQVAESKPGPNAGPKAGGGVEAHKH